MDVLALAQDQGRPEDDPTTLPIMNELFEAGGLECVIDGTYPLRELPQALQRFGEAKHVGKVVIDVASEPARTEA